MTPIEYIEDWLTSNGLVSGYVIQLGAWIDSDGPEAAYAVIKPIGGSQAGLVRITNAELSLIGPENTGWDTVLGDADAILEQARLTAGQAVYIGASEPVPLRSAEGRPIVQLPIEVILS